MEKASALRETQLWLRSMDKDEALTYIAQREQDLDALIITYRQRMSQVEAVRAQWQLDEIKEEISHSAAAHGGKPFAHPYWWAGLQCVGAG